MKLITEILRRRNGKTGKRFLTLCCVRNREIHAPGLAETEIAFDERR